MMLEIIKGIAGFLMIAAFCAVLYGGLGAACVAMHGVAACVMDTSAE